MESPSLPQLNYVGLLQEQCGKKKWNLPEYVENPPDSANKYFGCTCKVKDWTAEGKGFSKKIAKQIAAKAMYDKIEKENLLQVSNSKDVVDSADSKSHVKSAVSKLYEYCKREGKGNPLFSEMPEEEELFVFSCTVDGFTGVGKGPTKKTAKEACADLVAKHFKIHNYMESVEKLKERETKLKNPCALLHELCQSKKLSFTFNEKKVKVGPKQEAFVVTCTVGEMKTESGQNSSKKLAKLEAAHLMLNLINLSTPGSSPVVKNEEKKELSNLSEGEVSDNQDIVSDSDEEESDNQGVLSDFFEEESDNQEILSDQGGESSDDEPIAKRTRVFE